MIPTQHDPGNTTAPTASAPVGAGVSVAALYAATAAQPYHSHQASNGRLVDAFYLLPGHAERAEGDYLDAAELSIWHHKDAKCYRATLSASSIRLHGGMFGQRFSLFAAARAQRYSPPKSPASTLQDSRPSPATYTPQLQAKGDRDGDRDDTGTGGRVIAYTELRDRTRSTITLSTTR